MMLLKNYDNRQLFGDWWWSEKLDGMRAIWDGYGPRVVEFTESQSGPNKYVGPLHVTGLWSRGLKPISCPASFTEGLPLGVPLDGELHSSSLSLHQILSITRRKIPGYEWRQIKFKVFDIPFLRETKISLPEVCKQWPWTLAQNYKLLRELEGSCSYELVSQTPIGSDNPWDLANAVYDSGGEGIVLRAAGSYWKSGRGGGFKVKPVETVIGTVVGVIPGKGKYEGMVGSYTVEGKEGGEYFSLNVSGFSDHERKYGGNVRMGQKMSVTCRVCGEGFVEPRFHKWI